MDNIPQRVYNGVVKLGSTATFSVETGGSYNVATGSWTGSSVTTAQVPTSPPVDYRTFYRQSNPTQEGSSVVVVPGYGLTFTPKIGMTFQLSGKRWRVLNYRTHELAGTVLAYELEVAIG